MAESVAGELLIASPSMTDWFRRAVILVVEHTEQGAFGLVLNRPSETIVGEAAPELAELIGPDLIHIGGPVAPNAVTALGDHADPASRPSSWSRWWGWSTSRTRPRYPGCASSPVTPAGAKASSIANRGRGLDRRGPHPDDPFGEGDLWARVLRRKGGEFALLARMPEDPSVN